MIPFLMIMIIVDDTIIYGLFIDDSIFYMESRMDLK